LSSKRVLHQSSNTNSMDEQESGIEDCVEYESASESSESVSSAQPALANKSRVAGKSAAPPNPPESDWHSNPNVPGIRKVGSGGLNQNPSLKQKPRVSFDYSNIERSRQNTSSNKTSAASRSHTNSRTHPSDSQSTSLTPNPANHSSHSQRTLPAVYPGTYPFDGRRNFPIKNPGTNHSDGRPTSTNNRIVPDSFIRSSDPGHHSHEGATSNRGVTPPRTGKRSPHWEWIGMCCWFWTMFSSHRHYCNRFRSQSFSQDSRFQWRSKYVLQLLEFFVLIMNHNALIDSWTRFGHCAHYFRSSNTQQGWIQTSHIIQIFQPHRSTQR
jgi:hypothetical protein